MPLIKTKTNQKYAAIDFAKVHDELYLVKLQPKRLKFIDGKNNSRFHGLKRGLTLRVMATSDADAQQKALNRKRHPKTKHCGYIVRWSRKFHA